YSQRTTTLTLIAACSKSGETGSGAAGAARSAASETLLPGTVGSRRRSVKCPDARKACMYVCSVSCGVNVYDTRTVVLTLFAVSLPKNASTSLDTSCAWRYSPADQVSWGKSSMSSWGRAWTTRSTWSDVAKL